MKLKFCGAAGTTTGSQHLLEVIDSFSGHADHGELPRYFDGTGGSREEVWLVHGEPDRSEALATTLRERHSSGEISVAKWKEVVEF